ncbi:MAG TPA: EAL domain-containing protein [Tepidisphaeraceae bacterium]|nr:EAL domain-containing protein [Tepidisphaeraceae bacterium]
MAEITQQQELQNALQALVAAQEKYRDIFDNATEGIYQTKPEGTYLSANPALARILGYESASELIVAVGDIENQLYVDPGRRRDFIERMRGRGRVIGFESRVYRKDGSIIWVSENCRCVRDGNGDVLYYEGTCTDITERRAATEALRESEERYALAMRGANDGIFDWNLKTAEIYFSERWKQMLGCNSEEMTASPREWFQRVHPEDLGDLQAAIASHWDGSTQHFEIEHRMRHADGGWRWMLSRGIAIRHSNGKATRMAGSMTDITKRKEAEAQLLQEALRDSLTGLPNRALFMDRLERAVVRGRREGEKRCAVLFLDMDRFKVVNDSLGHQAGDQLLVDFANRLAGCLRPGDTVARLGGDEFTVLLEDVHSESEAMQIADRMLASLKHEFQVSAREVFVTASIGIALSGIGDSSRPQDLLRDADTAMYRAKAAGRNRHQLFDAAMHQRVVKLLDTEHDLRRAIERGEFELHYQPIVRIDTGLITAFESLIRWRRPDVGLVMPGEFISVAEETGLITSIGKWALYEACRQMAAWHNELPKHRDVKIAVNLSAKQFAQPDLCEQIQDALRRSGLAAGALILEITETVVMDNAEQAAAVLRRLKALGARVNIDDFGTGYSSLAYLQKFPVDTMKIDRSFISRLDNGDENQEIVRTIVTLAHNLNMTVTAEGVETESQMQHLATMACENSQGFLLSKPLSAADARQLLADPAMAIGKLRLKASA